jgi:hypothetical protein
VDFLTRLGGRVNSGSDLSGSTEVLGSSFISDHSLLFFSFSKIEQCRGRLQYGLKYVNFLQKLVSSVSPTWAYGKGGHGLF